MAFILPAVKECVDSLRKLNGLPPYDTPDNIARSDGYFSKAIERDFSKLVRKEADKIIKRETALWELHRKAFLHATKG